MYFPARVLQWKLEGSQICNMMKDYERMYFRTHQKPTFLEDRDLVGIGNMTIIL